MAVNQYYICFHRSISLLELLNLLRCSECRKRNLLIHSSLEHFKRRIKRSPSFAHPEKPEGQYRLWSSQITFAFQNLCEAGSSRNIHPSSAENI
jgi:hypothetical protein